MEKNTPTGKNEQKERRKPGIRQIIYASITCLLCLLFVIWTGYWIVLILIPVFIDIYITKFVPWSAWRNAKNPHVRKVLDWVDAILFALVGVWIINTFFFQNYQIPSSSLEKSLLVGDFLCVSKVSYGARSPMTPFSLPLMQHTFPLFGFKSYLEKPQVEYQRFTGTGKIERNDIVVFNYPSGDTVALNYQNQDFYSLCKAIGQEDNPNVKRTNRELIAEGRQKVLMNKNVYGDVVYRPVDRRENYVKRCIGLPGDILSIIDNVVYINDKAIACPEEMQLLYCVQTSGSLISPAVFTELGMSEEDRIQIGYTDLHQEDSTSVIKSIFTEGNTETECVYFNVNMTQEMVQALEKKPFVKKIISQNIYYKESNNQVRIRGGRLFYQPDVYPITYDMKIEYGDFPKLWIPKQGETIRFDTDVEYKVAAYERCIKNYEHNDFEYRDGKVYINGQQTDSYTFKFDYFFMMGDNRDKSADSRAWGLVPEDHIVGKPLFIWLSLDKDKGWFSGKIRWSRLFTSGNKK